VLAARGLFFEPFCLTVAIKLTLPGGATLPEALLNHPAELRFAKNLRAHHIRGWRTGHDNDGHSNHWEISVQLSR